MHLPVQSNPVFWNLKKKLKEKCRKESNDMQLDMTRGKIMPILLRFTIPLMIGNMFQQLYNMADTIIVGRFVGAGALAAVGSTGTIMFLTTGFAQGVSSGFSVVVSQKYGAKDFEGVKRSVTNGILLSILASILMTCFCLAIMHPLLLLMNTPADIFDNAYTYIMIISAGISANVFYNLFSAYLRAVGNSQVPLFFLIFSACLNVGLDLLLIVNLQMGVAGAAWATNLSQLISAVLCAIYIWLRSPDLKPRRNHWKFSGSITRAQLAAGIPMSIQFAITSSGTMIMQSAVNLFGSEAVAAYTAVNKLQNLVIQGMIAMGQTMATYGGQNYGCGNVRRIKDGVKNALIAETIYSILAAITMVALFRPCLGLFFTGDVDLNAMIPWAKTYCNLCILFFIPLSTIFIFRNIMQGCGYGFLPMMGGVVELFARLFVSMASMKLYSYFLACFADPAAWFSAGVFTGISYLFVIKKIQNTFDQRSTQPAK